jgi:nitrate/TMAO reductase-like tetraheme cytochrome c subunit
VRGAQNGEQRSMGSPAPRRAERRSNASRWLTALAVVIAGGLMAVGGWVGTDRLEQDNDFCNACHLDGWLSGTPLHLEHRRDLDARPPLSLAAAHAAAGHRERPDDPAFRCIDCHGGVGLVGRARVKVLAAKDAFWWVVGRFEEPDGMHWPLLEQDCRQCHPDFETKAGEFEDPAFHDLPVHNRRLGVECVECHLAHETDVDRDRWHLAPDLVREQCARCHSELAGL